jgi:hypothetical protein
MVSIALVVGYHGCDRGVAEKIVAGREELTPSENAWDWLGHGSYFWEDSPDRARRWAEEEARKHNSGVEKPEVIGAVIALGHCLNLADSEALGMVKAAHAAYLEICKSSRTPPARNRGPELRARYLDCAVLETLHGLRDEKGLSAFDTVRGFFIEGRPVYPTAGFRELDHVQICVRSSRQIVGYFWPRAS